MVDGIILDRMDSRKYPVCVSMPSALAARDLFAGVPGSPGHLLFTYLARSAVVATGMVLAGKRKNVARDALAGTAVIEDNPDAAERYFLVSPRNDSALFEQMVGCNRQIFPLVGVR